MSADARRYTPLAPEDIEPQSCDTALRLRLLAGLPFFAGLDRAAVAEINTRFHEKGFAAGEMIYTAGDHAAELFVVAAGKVKLLRHTLAGQDVLLDILAQGEFFGTLSPAVGSEYPETAQAQTTCCALSASADDFQAILREHPLVALAVLQIVQARLQAAQETVQQLSAASVESRVAAVLLKLADKLGEPRPEGLLIQMPLSRQDIAQLTGATVETASRVVSQFRKDGLVRSGRQWVAILDRDALAAVAARG